MAGAEDVQIVVYGADGAALGQISSSSLSAQGAGTSTSTAVTTVGQRINASLSGELYKAGNDVWCIGYDPGEIFNHIVHSTGFIFLLCLSMPARYRFNKANVKLLVCIPGPKQPETQVFDKIVQNSIAKPFASLADASRSTRHFLIQFFADSQARPKLSLTSFPAALAACFRCFKKGVHLQNATRFLGYVDGSCSAAMQKSDREARQLATLADVFAPGSRENATMLQESGHSGTSSLAKFLPYLDMVDSFCIPFCHAMTGLLKQFFHFILRDDNTFTIPVIFQDLIRNRRKLMPNVIERGRSYKCIVDARGSYVIEDWLNFLLDDSLYIMTNVFDYNPRLGEALDCLRVHAMHHLTCEPTNKNYDASRVAAHDNIMRFGYIMEELQLYHKCTFNLHLLSHMYHQETAVGATCLNLELWFERAIGRLKKIVKYRVSAHPELVMINHFLWESAGNSLKQTYNIQAHENSAAPQLNQSPRTADFIDGGSVCDMKAFDEGLLIKLVTFLQRKRLLVAGFRCRHFSSLVSNNWVSICEHKRGKLASGGNSLARGHS